MTETFRLRPSRWALAAIGAAIGLAGCSGPAEPVETNIVPVAESVAPPESPLLPPRAESETRGGDGSAITLGALTADDVRQAALGGELGCGFGTAEGAQLLIAMGIVASAEPARGIVKVGDHVEPVGAPGGFDAMLDGATFTGRGMTIRIATTGPARGGGESPPRPATLTYDRADGAQRSFAGDWTCGP